LLKKLHFFIEYTAHYFKRYFLVILLGLIAGSAIFIEKNHLIDIYQSLQIQHSHIGIEGLYIVSSLPTNIVDQISYGFTVNNENNKPELSPIIASLTTSEDNRSYTFTFKDNLYWHNGSKFQTGDIELNIPGAQIIPRSQNKLEIKLQDPYSPLLSLLTQPIFYKKTLIGLGPYKFSQITYQDGYIKTLTLTNQQNSRQIITYHFYSNSQDLLTAFKLGEVDEITSSSLSDELSKWPKINITPQISTTEYLAVFFNTEKLSSKQLRQAIAYATPKSTDKNDRCLGPISTNSWAYNSEIKEYIYNPDQAKELFAPNKIDQITLTVGDRTLLNTAEQIKTAWEQNLGIKVTINANTNQIDLSTYDAILTYGIIPDDPDQYSFWHSTQTSTNITHLNNPRIDKLLEQGRQTFDQPERKKIYYDFQRFLLEESPAVFLKFPTTYNISRVK
jgi:peptide/nickel transport system substrate-binding protein